MELQFHRHGEFALVPDFQKWEALLHAADKEVLNCGHTKIYFDCQVSLAYCRRKPLGCINQMLGIFPLLARDQAPLWGKKAQNKNRQNIFVGEQSELNGGLGRRKGRRSLETCLWCRRSMIPDSGVILLLVKCLHVDRFEVLLIVLRSSPIRENIFKTRILSRRNEFLCETFRFTLGSKTSKTYTSDRLQKENLCIQNIELFLHFFVINYCHLYKALDL